MESTATNRATGRARLRDALIAAARELTVAHGWKNVGMAQVARAAGVSRQTVYNEFDGRAGLAGALVLHEVGRFVGRRPDRAVRPGRRRPRGRARRDPAHPAGGRGQPARARDPGRAHRRGRRTPPVPDDPKRPLWPLALVVPALPFAALLLATVTGSSWAWWLTPVVILGVIPAVDVLIGDDRANPPDEAVPALQASPSSRLGRSSCRSWHCRRWSGSPCWRRSTIWSTTGCCGSATRPAGTRRWTRGTAGTATGSPRTSSSSSCNGTVTTTPTRCGGTRRYAASTCRRSSRPGTRRCCCSR